MVTVSTLLLSAVGLLLCGCQIGQAQETKRALTLGTELYRGCQGRELALTPCGTYQNRSVVLHIKSVTIFTTSDINRVRSCRGARECERVIHDASDEGLRKDYQHLYLWIASRCEGKSECDATNGTLPEWWKLVDVDGDGVCTVLGKTQYFAGVLVDVDCQVSDPIPAVPYPPVTPPKTRPTTPTTTTPFPEFIDIYVPGLADREKVILGVAIGLALAIILMLLIVLYCCERYRNHKWFGKRQRMLGAPRADEEAFDELQYGKQETWQDETQNLDALGEYTGVKPDEFLTLDKHTMEKSGQIMYDTTTTTMNKGNSCSTLDRLDKRPSPTPGARLLDHRHRGPVDYDTEENLELERRMAAAAYTIDDNYQESPQL